jgi:uncharacterized protein (TIGR03437 family)
VVSFQKDGPRAPLLGENSVYMKLLGYFLVATVPVLAQNVSPAINGSPSRQFGQTNLPPSLNSIAPNLVEGRELNAPFAVAFDTSVTPAILYVADSANNRILAWKNPGILATCGINQPTCGFPDLVLGQRDFASTLAGGPNNPSGISSGFAFPTGIAVDSSGNVYVADAGNNRILRFPSPFKQPAYTVPGTLFTVDLIIGQKTLSSGNSPNEGNQTPSSKTIATNNGTVSFTSVAIEPGTGNLWVTDPGNNRVLRYPAGNLTGVEPQADLVLGQTDLNTGTLPQTPSGQTPQFVLTAMPNPRGLAFDAKGRLYVSDAYSRVLFFTPPLTTGMSASRFLGIAVSGSIGNQPPLPPVNAYGLNGPSGLGTNGTNLFVADINNNRVVEYDVPENWPPPPNLQSINSQISPAMITVTGQNDLQSGSPNKGGKQIPDSTTLSGAFGIAFNGTDMWVADTSNHRVLDFQSQGGRYIGASRLVGQVDYPYNSPNLIEGREVFFSTSGTTSGGAAGIVVDHNSNPPHLYVADTFNNRILCFKDVRTVQTGTRADLIIGQADAYSALVNSPNNDPNAPTQGGLYHPIGLVVDSFGNLYVADNGNGRVLRFPAPFNVPSGSPQMANLVLGQGSFNGPTITDVAINTMRSPWGVALLSNGSLAVSDSVHNRILIFKKPTSADFTNGQLAATVLGQSGFTTSAASNAAAGMNSPRHIAVDSSDRVYLCDSANNRVIIFTNATTISNGQASALQLNNLGAPQGVIVSSSTGEIWITTANGNQVYRLPEYLTLSLNTTPSGYPVTATITPQTAGLAVALDNSDNLILAEAANRVTFFFAQLTWRHVANYNQQPIAPGMLAYLARVGKDFNLAPNTAASYPWQTTMSDLQVLVNGTASPIFAVTPSSIYFQVPSSTPDNGTANYVVMRPSTGEILSAGTFPMAKYNPGFFTSNAQGFGQVAAFNDDGTINGPGKGVSRDGTHFISFCLTGGGVFVGGAPDGAAPVVATTQVQPLVLSGGFSGQSASSSQITYSGAGCGFPGGWQINVTIPNTFAPGSYVVAVSMDSIGSNIGPNGPVQVSFTTK